jgi:NitT/TauT family transport system ATP-binding protein
MQQRLSIAQSVICEPRSLLLDEPFGALDPGIRGDMHRLILELWSANRMSVLMISHEFRESFELGTRLLPSTGCAWTRSRPNDTVRR